jgi:putative addiction module component (TIGR02574 family)
METSELLLEKAMRLNAQDRLFLVDGLIQSLDKPDKTVDAIWAEEAEKRLKAHREGKTQCVSYDDVFGESL